MVNMCHDSIPVQTSDSDNSRHWAIPLIGTSTMVSLHEWEDLKRSQKIQALFLIDQILRGLDTLTMPTLLPKHYPMQATSAICAIFYRHDKTETKNNNPSRLGNHIKAKTNNYIPVWSPETQPTNPKDRERQEQQQQQKKQEDKKRAAGALHLWCSPCLQDSLLEGLLDGYAKHLHQH